MDMTIQLASSSGAEIREIKDNFDVELSASKMDFELTVPYSSWDGSITYDCRIYIPDTEINYPIVQAKDNSTYLHKTFRGKDSYVGAIFLDAFCKPDFSSFNSIIYGHNLKNGEMFGHLKKLYDVEYNGKADYKKHPKIWIITPDDAYEYTIFAFREISVKNDKDVYTVDQSVSKERRKFLDGQIRKSQKKTRMSPSENRRMITLSTCTSHTEDGRFVVQAGNID